MRARPDSAAAPSLEGAAGGGEAPGPQVRYRPLPTVLQPLPTNVAAAASAGDVTSSSGSADSGAGEHGGGDGASTSAEADAGAGGGSSDAASNGRGSPEIHTDPRPLYYISSSSPTWACRPTGGPSKRARWSPSMTLEERQAWSGSHGRRVRTWRDPDSFARYHQNRFPDHFRVRIPRFCLSPRH